MRWLLVLTILLLADCSNCAGASKPRIVFDGDSITDIETPAIHKLLDPSYDVEVLAVDGMRINQRLPALASVIGGHPYAVVENLGTNDALQGGVHYDWVSSWDKLIRITKSTPCVVLTTISIAADAYSHKPIATRINTQIKALAARDPRKYKVADWSNFLIRHENNWRTYLQPELIHETAAGAVELATLDQNALAKCGSRTS